MNEVKALKRTVLGGLSCASQRVRGSFNRFSKAFQGVSEDVQGVPEAWHGSILGFLRVSDVSKDLRWGRRR